MRCVSPKLERFELLAHSAAVAFHDANQLGLLRARPTSVVQTEIEAKQLAAAMREQYDAALFRSMREEIARGRLAPWAVLGGVLASGGAALRYALEFHARRAGAAEVHLADVEELFGQAGAALGASDDLGRAVGLLELILLTVAARGAGVGDAPYFEPVAAMLGLDVEAIKEDADARVRTAARKGSEQ